MQQQQVTRRGGVLVLQIENRSSPFYDRVRRRNAAYCARHGFEHVYMRGGTDDVPFYWWKVFEVHRLLRARPDVALVMWLDSDAFVHDTARPLWDLVREHARPGTGMVASSNVPPWEGARFNAGVFIVLNNGAGRAVVERWRALYDPGAWTRDAAGGWSCTGADCGWAGRQYEEGAFLAGIMEHPGWRALAERVVTLPHHVLQEVDWARPRAGCFSFHLAAFHKENGLRAVEASEARHPSAPPASAPGASARALSAASSASVTLASLLLLLLALWRPGPWANPGT